MASQFQNRLVGVTILVASVVIFLPSIMDGKKATYEDEFVSTPIKPQLKEHTQQLVVKPSEPSQSAEINQENAIIENSIIENNDWEIQEVAEVVTTVTAEPKVKPIIESPEPVAKVTVPEQAWVIQLGAFASAKNINNLLKKLHKAGYQAHTVPNEVIDGELTRVFIGPNVFKDKLEKQLPQLKRLTKLQGKLIPFDAVNP